MTVWRDRKWTYRQRAESFASRGGWALSVFQLGNGNWHASASKVIDGLRETHGIGVWTTRALAERAAERWRPRRESNLQPEEQRHEIFEDHHQ
jgi:hypothetical protein